MKILIVTNELLNTCGISKHLLYFLREMKDQHEFEFSILCGGGDAVDIYRNYCKEVIIEEKIKHENRTYFNYFISFIKIYRLAKKNQYNIIHSHHHYAANICSKVSYFTGIVDVQTNHGILPDNGWLNHFSAEYIICVNDHIVEYLQRAGIKPLKKIKLIYYGIHVHNIPEETSNQKFRVIAASRMVPEKGMDIYIKAVVELPSSIRKQAEFLLAGKGPQEKYLRKLNDELNAGIDFVGEVKDLRETLKTTNIFVLPSISDSEGFPLTLIEAALTKNVIISSDFRGINPIVSENPGVLLFEKGNYQMLADKLLYAIKNYSKYYSQTDSLCQKVRDEFNLKKMVSALKQFYNSIV